MLTQSPVSFLEDIKGSNVPLVFCHTVSYDCPHYRFLPPVGGQDPAFPLSGFMFPPVATRRSLRRNPPNPPSQPDEPSVATRRTPCRNPSNPPSDPPSHPPSHLNRLSRDPLRVLRSVLHYGQEPPSRPVHAPIDLSKHEPKGSKISCHPIRQKETRSEMAKCLTTFEATPGTINPRPSTSNTSNTKKTTNAIPT